MMKQDFDLVDETKYLNVDGKNIEYQWVIEPKQDQGVIVFLHEGLGCKDMWKGFPKKLAQQTGLAALTYSRAGYGLSSSIQLPRNQNYMQDEGIDVLPKLLSALGIQKSVLFGHSDGGSIALINAGAHPNSSVQAIILEAPHVFIEKKTVDSITQVAKNYQNSHLKKALSKYHGDNLDCAFYGFVDTWLNPVYAKNWNIEGYVKNVNVPTLLFQGDNDEFGTSEQVNRIQAQIKGEFEAVMIENCGHVPHVEQPDLVLKRSTDFLKRLAV